MNKSIGTDLISLNRVGLRYRYSIIFYRNCYNYCAKTNAHRAAWHRDSSFRPKRGPSYTAGINKGNRGGGGGAAGCNWQLNMIKFT